MISKTKTIWKFSLVFSDSIDALNEFDVDYCSVMYRGTIEDMPGSVAAEVAEIHPKFNEYYDMAMMPLYKTYGKYKNGTEDPVFAIESLKTNKESECEMDYVLIWKIFK